MRTYRLYFISVSLVKKKISIRIDFISLNRREVFTAERCSSETEKNIFRGSFQFSIVTIQKISPLLETLKLII